MPDTNFIHLHVHTEYSLLDGAAPVSRLVETAAQLNMPAIAMTDHGNMYATIKFYNACLGNKIKPIIGCECYMVEDRFNKTIENQAEKSANHLILLAKNNDGFHNLSRLNSIGFIEGMYYGKPRIDWNILKKYSGGLICLSACIAGGIPRLLLLGDYEGAKEYALKLKSLFDDGDFYIELQNHDLEEEKRVNPLLVQIAREIGVKCVATNDVHYIEENDAEMHDALLCIQTGSYIDDINRMHFPNKEFYLKNKDQMAKLFSWCPQAIETPNEIAEKCNVTFEFNQYQLPNFSCPDGLTPAEYLKKLTFEGLAVKCGKEIPLEYIERANTELQTIIEMGFAEYYLIVWDFIFWAKSQDIPVGPGRGSGVGSLVAYSIGITAVDPIKHNLFFERFLNKSRLSMPDFDIDLCYNRRGEVIEYVKRKYGEDHISQIVTFNTMQKKGAIKDVARVYRLPFQDVSKITKEIPFFGPKDKEIHIQDLLNPLSTCNVPTLIDLYKNNDSYKKILDIAMKVEGMPKNSSIHAAGVVIYKNKAIDTIPLAKNNEEITTQFDNGEVEKLGLLKMDFLALMTLTDIKMAHDSVKRSTGMDVDFNKIGYDDLEVYNMIGQGSTDAVFQLEGGGMKSFMTSFKPQNIEDITAGISIYRPGPMKNKGVFLENRRNPSAIVYKHPDLEPILNLTSGIMIYQEQAMTISRKLAGYSAIQADNLRAIFSKKKLDKLPKEEQMFIHGKRDKNNNLILNDSGLSETPGCINNNISEEIAKKIWDEMKDFGEYAFNKSHAAAYAVLSYQTAYYKYYYPVDYMAAVVNNRIDKPDDIKKYMQVLKSMNIKVLSPDVNKSSSFFTPENGAIRYGLGCIKNVGMKATEDYLITERSKNGPFKSLYDFVKRVDSRFVNKSSLESLILGGAFDSFKESRATLMANYENIIANVTSEKKSLESGQQDMFSILGDNLETTFKYKKVKEYDKQFKLTKEKEMLKIYISDHPLSGLEKEFEQFNFNTSMIQSSSQDSEPEVTTEDEETSAVQESPLTDNMNITTGGIISSFQKKRTKDGKEIGILKVEDLYDTIEVIIYDRQLQACKDFLAEEKIIKINGKLSFKDNEPKIYANKITPWEVSYDSEETFDFMEDGKAIYFLIDEEDKGKYDRIVDVLKLSPGDREVFMQYKGKIYDTGVLVSNLNNAKVKIEKILGPQKVKIVDKISPIE